MKKVAIIGAGMMTRPIANYLLDQCGYKVVMVDQDAARAQKIIAGRPGASAVGLLIKKSEDVDAVVREVDIVISMVPRPLHILVANSCLRHNKSMLTTSFEPPEIKALAVKAEEKGLLFLNEMGEDPGLDHFGTQVLLDEIRQEGGEAVDVKSYGCGIPAFEHNNNPMGYKFSWDPHGLFTAARTPAAYYIKGNRIEIPGDQLFRHFRLLDIEGLGTFETYPNRDCRRYLEPFALGTDVSYYRGLLRHPGYCNNMRCLREIGLFKTDQVQDFEGVTCRQLTASLVGAGPAEDLESAVAHFLDLDRSADFIHRLKWLGFFDDRPIQVKKGTRLDVLLERMLARMCYAPHEKDMIIVHIQVAAEFPDKKREKRTATMKMEGIPYGDSAMSRAVGLPIAIGARLVLEGKIRACGVHIPPTIPGLCSPLLDELAQFEFVFKKKTSRLENL